MQRRSVSVRIPSMSILSGQSVPACPALPLLRFACACTLHQSHLMIVMLVVDVCCCLLLAVPSGIGAMTTKSKPKSGRRVCRLSLLSPRLSYPSSHNSRSACVCVQRRVKPTRRRRHWRWRRPRFLPPSLLLLLLACRCLPAHRQSPRIERSAPIVLYDAPLNLQSVGMTVFVAFF